MSSNDLTCVYYTNNKEDPRFEENIRQTLLETIGDLPLISVSQKPIDFGKNICVGDVGSSSYNAWRQYQIGAMEAKTRFVCTAEADFLHPREYFEFVPNADDTCYIAMPLYVIFTSPRLCNRYYPKPNGSEGSMIVGRDYILGMMDRMLPKDMPWSTDPDRKVYLLSHGTHEKFHLSVPLVTFKTDRNMHRKTPIVRSRRIGTLPYWGKSRDLVRKYS